MSVSELRFIERDGKRVLQQWFGEMCGAFKVWLDVPLVVTEEPKRLVERLYESAKRWDLAYHVTEALAVEAKKAVLDEINKCEGIETAHYSDLIVRSSLIRRINEL